MSPSRVFRAFFAGAKGQAYQAPRTGEIWGLLVVLALSKVRNLVEHHTAAKRDVRATGPADADALSDHDERTATLLRMVVEEQIAAFPPHGRPIVRLRLEGYEVSEIAARTGHSPRTVERILQRFRRCLTDA